MIALEHLLSQPLLATQESIDAAVSFLERRASGDPGLLRTRDGRPTDNTRATEMRGSVAVIPVQGAIFRHANLLTEACGYPTTEALARDITSAIDDPMCSALVLDIDSPGGQASGISELAALIRAGTDRKPIVAYSDSEAASALYWVAAACSEIVGSATAMFGSIGVKMAMTKKASKNGETTYEWVNDESPDKNPDPSTERGKATIQRTVNDMASVFISAVAEYRDVPEEKVRADFGKGWVLIGQKAVDVGMIDRIASLENVIEELEAANKRQMSSNFNVTASQENFDMGWDSKTLKRWILGGMPEDFDPAKGGDPSPEPKNIAVASLIPDQRVSELEEKLRKSEEKNKALAQFSLEARRESIEAQVGQFLVANQTRVLPVERERLKASLVQAMMDDDLHPLAVGSRAQNLRDATSSRPEIKELREVVPSGALPPGLTLLAQHGEQQAKEDPNADTSPQAIEALFSQTAGGRSLLAKNGTAKN
jgi:signal peptide peptidase SppA